MRITGSPSAKRDALPTLLVLLLSLILLLGPLPGGPSLLAQTIENAGHAALFAIIVWFPMRWSARLHRGDTGWSSYVAIWLLAVLFGGLTEIIQGFTGRDPSWLDLVDDASGAALMLTAIAMRRRRIHRLAATAFIMGALWLALPWALMAKAYGSRAALFPILLQPGSPAARAFVEFTGASSGTSDSIDACPAGTLRVPLDRSPYPGVALNEPYRDWRRYGHLLIDLSNPAITDLHLSLRVNDRRHDGRFTDRYNLSIPLGAAERRVISVPIEAIAHAPLKRTMDLEHIAAMMIFRTEPAPSAAFCVFSARLSAE